MFPGSRFPSGDSPSLLQGKNIDDDGADDDLDGEGAAERKSYRLKLSRWYKGAFYAIKNPIFWFCLYMCRVVRRPLTHFYLYLQKVGQNNNSGKALFHLVCHKLDEFKHEYHQLLTHLDSILEEALRLSDCSALPNDVVMSLKLMGWKLILQQWSALERRIVKPLQQCLDCLNTDTDWKRVWGGVCVV